MNVKPRYPVGVTIEPVPSLPSSRSRFLEIPAEEMLLATTPRMNANAPTLASHTIRLLRSARSACAVGEDRSPRRGSALSRAGSTPVPMSRLAAIRAASQSSSAALATGRTSTSGCAPANGRSSSAHPSGVTQRSQATPLAVSAITRSRNHTPSDRAAELERHPPCRRELAGQRADAGAHRHDRHGGQREVRRAAGRQPADDEARRARRPTAARCRPRSRRSRTGTPCAARRSQRARAPAARVLLGAQRSHGGEQAEDRGEDRQRPADPPCGVAAHGEQVVRLAVEQAHRLVVRRSCGRSPTRSATRRVSRGGSRPAGCRRTARTGRRRRSCARARRGTPAVPTRAQARDRRAPLAAGCARGALCYSPPRPVEPS